MGVDSDGSCCNTKSPLLLFRAMNTISSGLEKDACGAAVTIAVLSTATAASSFVAFVAGCGFEATGSTSTF